MKSSFYLLPVVVNMKSHAGDTSSSTRKGQYSIVPKERALIPLCVEVKFDVEGVWEGPPDGVKLSDELVYLASKFLPTKVRGNRYRYRLPMGTCRQDL